MKKEFLSKLFTALNMVFLLVGTVCLGISIFGKREDNTLLSASLFCIALANLISTVRLLDRDRKKGKEEHDA